MKQIELAKQLDISKSYLSMILSGQRVCPPKLADRLNSQKVVNFYKKSGKVLSRYERGAEETRTPDFLRAREALSQLSYSPKLR